MFDINEMRNGILRIIDPDDPYTEEDFNKEFSITNNGNFQLKIKFENLSNNLDPDYNINPSHGFNIRAFINDNLIIKPNEIITIPTGLYFELPKNIDIQIRSTPELLFTHHILILNNFINSNKEETKLILGNFGTKDFTIKNGDIIAHGVVITLNDREYINLEKK